MIEFYPGIKLVHVWSVIASGLLFALRGGLLLAGVRGANHAVVRWLAVSIDTVLLTAALMLATMLRQYPFVHGWLTAKVVLLVVYIGVGTLALKRAKTTRARAAACATALAIFLAIVSIARAHHPLGALARVFG